MLILLPTPKSFNDRDVSKIYRWEYEEKNEVIGERILEEEKQ